MEEAYRIIDITKNMACKDHADERVSLICVGKNCCQDKFFCLQCFDGGHSDKHKLISIKKFSEMYEQYKHLQAKEARNRIKQQFEAYKEIVLDYMNELQKVLLQTIPEPIQLKGGQEQILRGQINEIAKDSKWNIILQEKKSKIKLDKNLEQKLKGDYALILENVSQNLNKTMKQVVNKIKDSFFLFESIAKSKLAVPRKQSEVFNKLRKHSSINIVENGKIAINLSDDFSHHFVVCSTPFTEQNNYCQFKIKSYGPNEDASLWFGATLPKISDQFGSLNIYDQGKGSYFAVIYDKGQKVNVWSCQRNQKIQTLDHKDFYQGTKIRVQINFKQNLCLIFAKKFDVPVCRIPMVPYNDLLYPVIGFCGLGSIQAL